MKLIGIKTQNAYFVSNNTDNNSYKATYGGNLSGYLFDGCVPTPTFKKDWWKLKTKPTKVEKAVKPSAINQRYELKDKKLKNTYSEIVPANERNEIEDIIGLYEYKYDQPDSFTETVEFDLEELLEVDKIEEPLTFSYKRAGEWNHKDYPTINENNIKYDLVSQILTPSILIHTQPCKLSRKESYDIVRKYIQENINPKVAKITSDYDFCLTVKKIIPLKEPIPYRVDVSSLKARKPKYQTRYQTEELVTVYETAPKVYQSYTVIEPFVGETQDKLKENIDNFLEELITVINTPLHKCENCDGCGVIVEKYKNK